MKHFLLLIISLYCFTGAFATGEPSTYFNIFVPPNNDPVQRNVCLIVTAIYDSTEFEIIDDNADGDDDDSYSGTLMAGQSYVLYIKDNGINDDARYASGGVLKQDGDYFIITSNNLVYASQSTNSDWQHDWVPSINKSSLGEKFIIFSPPTSFSNRDINVFAYQDSTTVTIRDISVTTTTITSLTNVDYDQQNIVAQKTINIGEDIIHYHQEGRDLLEPGKTYIVESNKPITVQYGALWTNARDGGGYVPSGNGTSSGDLFYFAVPYQVNKEQEIRIVSWDNSNTINLERYSSGSWINISSWNIDSMESADWVGRNVNATYPTTFRVSCSGGKKVSVFEANWMETGSPGTSDMATMVSSKNGGTAGKNFLVYMAPPGSENNVLNPFTGQKFNQQLTHVYVFARDTANITIKDAYSNGSEITRTYQILPNRYIDCYLTLSEWRSIYNGDGNPNSGPERPYLKIESDAFISVMNTNFNDNWMMYFGSSQEQSFDQTSSASSNLSIPGDTIRIKSEINFNSTSNLENVEIKVITGDGVTPLNSMLNNNTNGDIINGTINSNPNGETEIEFENVPDLVPSNDYDITTEIIMDVNYKNGNPIPNNTVLNIDNIVSGEINGVYQQSVSTEGIQNNSTNTENLIYTEVYNSGLTDIITNSWNASWVDYNNDGYDDIFVCDFSQNALNQIYTNNGDGTFSGSNMQNIINEPGASASTTFGDIDNDGDKDMHCAVNLGSKSDLYTNNGNPNYNFTKNNTDPSSSYSGYHHGSAFVDYNNDGNLDLFISDYIAVNFNELYLGQGDGSFTKVQNSSITNEASRSVTGSWGDYNNDGFQDLFIPNGDSTNNSLYKNLGNGNFVKISTGAIVNDGVNCVGSAWGDFNNDNYLDLYVTSSSNGVNYLYRNNGDETFTRITNGDIVNDKGFSHGCEWADVNNDGYIDLYVTNDLEQEKALYINNGDETFTKKTNEIIASATSNSRGIAFSDIDRDGDLDLFMSTRNEVDRFFINNGNSNNWVCFKLIGTNSNLSAIGARIRIKHNGRWQTREINAQSGFGGQNSMISHFGLGSNNSNIDSIVIHWPSGYKQYLINQTINQYHTISEDNSSLITGKVYHDIDSDCNFSEEPTISGVKVNATPGNYSSYTDDNGAFYLRVPEGTYSVTQEVEEYWNKTCSDSIVVNVTTIMTYDNINFSNTPEIQGCDLNVSLGSAAQRKGFQNKVNITLNNSGTESVPNCILSLELSPDLHPISSEMSYDSIANNTVYWSFTNLDPGSSLNFEFTDSVSVNSNVGDSCYFNLIVDNLGDENDLDETNNTFTLREEIVGAIDPNDIIVYPKGLGDKGLICRDQKLTYLIRFQNVGNYPAQFIEVTDYLPHYLDINTLKIESISHEATLNIQENRLNWFFNDIYLPDSNSNELHSHGHIRFSIYPKTDIKPRSEILNKAYIKFDFENSLETNTVINTIKPEKIKDEELIIYPNPTDDMINVLIEETNCDINNLKIYDISGRSIPYKYTQSKNYIVIKVDNMKNGIYLISYNTLNQNLSGKFIVNKNKSH